MAGKMGMVRKDNGVDVKVNKLGFVKRRYRDEYYRVVIDIFVLVCKDVSCDWVVKIKCYKHPQAGNDFAVVGLNFKTAMEAMQWSVHLKMRD